MSILERLMSLVKRFGNLITYPFWIKDYRMWKKASDKNPIYNSDCKSLVFVYSDNEKKLLKKAKFIESTLTSYAYFDLLIVEGRYPGMIYQDLNKNEGYKISGDLYEVDGRTLWKLEQMHWDSEFYNRNTIAVDAKDDNGYLISCLVYLIDHRREYLELKDDLEKVSLSDGIKKWE